MKSVKFLMIIGMIGVTFTILLLIVKKDEQRPAPPRSLHYLQLAHAFSDSRGSNLSEIVQNLNGVNKDQHLQIKFLNRESLNKQVVASTNDDMPDILCCQAGFYAQRLIDLGKIEPIDGVWQSFSLVKHFSSPNGITASTYNNHKYLIPISRSVVVFFYNKELLKTEKLRAPKSWEELVQLAEELRARNFIPFALGAKEQWPAQYWFDYLLLRTAGQEYRQKLMQNDASYTDPEVKRAFAMFGSLLQQGLFNADAKRTGPDTGRKYPLFR
jgi:ABC-type glycerol-3-phosphate transport system substrate-binding protein